MSMYLCDAPCLSNEELAQRMEAVLQPRELNLVRCYLGIGHPNEQGMTFQELTTLPHG